MEKETIEETFTYDLAIPVLRRIDYYNTKWNVIEKGIQKFDRFAVRKYLYYFSASNIRSALFDMRERVLKTPIYETFLLKGTEPSNIYIKTECCQTLNSVQARGVIYTLLQLSDEQKRKGVIAISTGCFAFILCSVGKRYGIPVTVVMPSSTAYETVDKCRELSATVIVRGNNMVDVHEIALRNARMNGLCYLDGNHPNMIIGQATLGIEIIEQMTEPDFDVLILPTMIDGCGLTAGIAIAVRESIPNKKIIEVQTDLQDSLIEDVRKITTNPYELDIPSRCYDAYVNFKTIQKGLFDLTIFVSQTDVLLTKQKEAILLERKDYYGAIAVTAIRSGRLNNLIKGKRVLIPFFGKTDLSMSFASNEPSLEPHADPSTSSS